ncbi:MAG TPA: TIGR02453 family protein [bacterium]|jgi:uncharacterized protein (TIGR02453 family)|nr:TIGR02453 family protein [bacterium]
MPALAKKPWFTRDFFQFLVELRFNNERPWFNANKARFEAQVKIPFQNFMAQLAPKVAQLNKAYTYPKAFRIYRDTRFAKDKTPYKTHAAGQFRHRVAADDVHAPGFYLHLEAGESFAGGGIWRPESEALKAVRDRIARKDPAWMAIKRSKMPLWDDDGLIRVPKGFDPEHPLAEDLKRRNFITWVDFTDKQVCAPDFLARVVDAFRKTNPLMLFLNKSMGL